MPPENQNQLPPQPTQPIGTPEQHFTQFAQPMAQSEQSPRRNKRWIVITCVVAVLIIGIIIAVTLMLPTWTKKDSTKTSDSPVVTGENPKEATSLELVKYESAEAGFTMMVPKEAELEGEADEVFTQGYTVSGGSSSDMYGNRLITVTKEVYGDSLQISYDEFLESTNERMQAMIDATQDSDVFETKAEITYESNWQVGEYRAQRYTLEESTRNTKKQDSKTSEYRTSYMYVYVNPTTAYELEIKGHKDDAAFQSVVSKMIESFLVK